VDVGLVDDVQAAQVFQAIDAAEGIRERRRCAVAVAGLVEGQHDVAAPRKLDREAALCFTRVEVAMHGQNSRRWRLRRRARRHVQVGTHRRAVAAGEAHVLDADATGRLHEVGEQHAAQDNQQADQQQALTGRGAVFGRHERVSSGLVVVGVACVCRPRGAAN
jgi:hypothetical protein